MGPNPMSKDAPSPHERDALSSTSGASVFQFSTGTKGEKVAGGGGTDARASSSNSAPKDSMLHGDSVDRGGHDTDAISNRVGSHFLASSSLHCDFSWLEGEIHSRMAHVVQRHGKTPNATSMVEHCCEIPKPFVKHVLGRGGRTFRRLEDFCGVFAFLGDTYESSAEVYLWGPPRACAIADFIISALSCGNFSIMDVLDRLSP